MKKILLALTLLILFIPAVNAEELTMPLEGMGIADSCSKNLIKADFGKFEHNGSYWGIVDSTSTSKHYFINAYFSKIKSNTTYYFSSNNKLYYTFVEYDENLNQVNSFSKWNNNSFTTTENTQYINFIAYTTYSDITNETWYYQLELGTTGTDYVEYEDCIINIEPTVSADTSLDTFYSIYLNKLVLLANFSTENKFVLSALVIILVFTLTGLFIHLFKGGRRQ